MLEVAIQKSPQVNLVGIGTVSELKRRNNDLSELPMDHPLKSLIVNCLRDDPKERPDTASLLKALHLLVKVSVDGLALMQSLKILSSSLVFMSPLTL